MDTCPSDRGEAIAKISFGKVFDPFFVVPLRRFVFFFLVRRFVIFFLGELALETVFFLLRAVFFFFLTAMAMNILFSGGKSGESDRKRSTFLSGRSLTKSNDRQRSSTAHPVPVRIHHFVPPLKRESQR